MSEPNDEKIVKESTKFYKMMIFVMKDADRETSQRVIGWNPELFFTVVRECISGQTKLEVTLIERQMATS